MEDKQEQKIKRAKKATPQPPGSVALQIKEIPYDDRLSTNSWNYTSDQVHIQKWFWDYLRSLTLKKNAGYSQPALQPFWERCFG